jgi:hypothetical protein
LAVAPSLCACAAFKQASLTVNALGVFQLIELIPEPSPFGIGYCRTVCASLLRLRIPDRRQRLG